MTSNEYDLIVIGAGGAGNTAAGNATVLGKRVALIKRDKLGGTCLNYGCDPTKTLCTPPRCFTMHVTPPPGFVGRLPALDALNLEAAGVQYTEEVITTDATLRPNVPHIWAAGDITIPANINLHM